jgi:hypothetical protein
MGERLSQKGVIQDFVAAFSMPNALVNHIGNLPFERYNAVPPAQGLLPLTGKRISTHGTLLR